MDLGLHQVQCAESGSSAGELSIGSCDDHVAEGTHGAGQDVKSDGVDAVVVGEQDSHETIVADDDQEIGIAW